MAFDQHQNFAVSLVATAPSPATSGTSLVVTAGQGSLFPTPPFNATVWPAGAQPTTANAEIVRVTGISTDTLTIARAQESSSARTVVIGDQIAATITAKTLTDVEAVAAAGMVRIARQVLGSPAATIDFSAIPGGYSALVLTLVSSSSIASTFDTVQLRMNANSGANYADFWFYKTIQGGNDASVTLLTMGYTNGASSPAHQAGAMTITIPNYDGTTFFKPLTWQFFAEEDATGGDQLAGWGGGVWRSQAAITELTLSLGTGPNFVVGTTATLYGLP